MDQPGPLSEHAQAVHDVLRATAHHDRDGRLVSTETLYRFIEDRFDLQDPQSRRVRTDAVRELTERGLVRRHNVRGPTVELLAAGDASGVPAGPSYEDYAAAITGDGAADLDVEVRGRRRVEQAFLRRVLLAGRASAPCAFCERVLPSDLLVAAHLQRRAELTRVQKLDFHAVAVLACTLGCDALYEQGYLGVDHTGLVITADVPPGPLGEHLAHLEGRPCAGFTDARAPYFARHRTECFHGTAADTDSAGATAAGHPAAATARPVQNSQSSPPR